MTKGRPGKSARGATALAVAAVAGLAGAGCGPGQDGGGNAPPGGTTGAGLGPERPAGATAAPGGSRVPAELDLTRVRVLDLTYGFGPNTIYWPTGTPFARKDTFRGVAEGGFYYSPGEYAASEHGGTHLDAPVHFAEHGASADQIAPDRLVGPAWVLDARAACATDRDHLVSVADFDGQVKATGDPPAGAIMLLHTGWGRHWPDRKAYLGDDRPGKTDALSFPGLDPALAKVLVERGVRAVGIDTASIDRGKSARFESHQVLAAANVPVYENVASLETLPAVGAWVVAAPMKIEGGTGGPLRLLALVEP